MIGNRRTKSPRSTWLLPFACAALLLPLAAQEQAPSLDALLGQLRATSPAAWDARVAAMQQAAKAARDAAVGLRAQAKVRLDEAAQNEATAQALDLEAGKLGEVRTALAAIGFRDPAAEGETAGSEQGQLETALRTLAALPAAAWEARVAAMKKAGDGHREAAKTLREAAAKLGAEAEQRDAAAQALDGEVGKLRGLRELVQKLELGTLATAPAAAAPETPPAAPAPKPEPVKEMPAKAMTAEAAAAERLLTYDEHVFPIFEEACITCHDPVDASGGLDLSTHAAVLQGGGSGRTLRPGQPDGSRLYLLVSHREKPTMPPDEPRIAAERIETIRLWIAQGAPKDRAQAERLAAERAAERARAAAEAAAGDTATAAAPVVMPEALPPLAKAWPRRPGALRAVAASPSAPLCAVPGFGQVLLYQADELRELGVLAFPFGQVERLAFSADGALLLAAGGTSGRIGGAVVYDVRSGAERGRFAEQGDTVLGADLSPDGRLVAVGGTRRRVEVFALDGGAAVWQGPHDDWVTAVAFSSDSALLASADRAGNVLVREAPNGREVHALTGHEGAVTSIAFRPGGDLLATAGVDRTVRAFRLRDGVQAWSETAHGDQVLCLTWASPSRLLSGGADGRVLHWQADGKRDPELPRLGEWVYGLAALDQGARVLAADWGGRLSVLDPKSRKLLAELVPLALVE